MKLKDKKLLCEALRAMGPPGTEQNRAKRYPAFGIYKGEDFRIAVHVGSKGTTVFTERRDLLDAFADKGIPYEECDQSKQYNKKRYCLLGLTIEQITDANREDFRTLVYDSIAIKESGL